MRVVRWVVLGTATFALGATAGFVVSLLRPRRYADFTGARTQ
jgi:hypothetical protein